MEDDEVTKNEHKPSPREVDGVSIDEKSLESLDFANTEQCEFAVQCLPELADPQLLEAEPSIEAKNDEAVAQEESSTEGTGMQTVAGVMSVPGMEVSPLGGCKSPVVVEDVDTVAEVSSLETKVAKDAIGGSFELYDSGHVGSKSPNTVDEVKTVVEEEITVADTEMELKNEAGPIESGLGMSISASVEAKDGEAVMEGEIVTADTDMEAKYEAEQVDSDIGKFAHELDNSQLIGASSLYTVEDGEAGMEKEIDMPGTELEKKSAKEGVEGALSESPALDEKVMEVEFPDAVSKNEVEATENDVVASEAEGSQPFATESSIAATETGMEDMEMDAHNVNAESPMVARDEDDDEDLVAEDETPTVDTEMETETEVAEMAEEGKGVGGVGKRKRGRISRVPAKAPARKVAEEDVCFICFDGGELVLCDRRGCPKAYHPSCVNRDEAFFRAKGRWNCGWHLCSLCEKNAHYMCYTCTFSLCKACIKDAVILCVRGNKGFCETCMRTVMLIENNEKANNEDRINFDDKSSWEYLFKDYWIDLKAKLSLSSVELAQAKNPWKGSDGLAGKQELPEEVVDAINDGGSGSDNSENLKSSKQKRRTAKKRLKLLTKEEDSPGSEVGMGAEGTSVTGNTEWASKELLEFVMHMKNGDKSATSQFEVQALLLEYIKRNKLRDPRKKSFIVCDARLENIFGKARVGHFEMLKLLESHFHTKEDPPLDDVQGSVVDTEANQLEADGTIDVSIKGSKDRKRKTRRKGYERGPQSNLDDYAAIDAHNINLIYLRRKLLEDLLEDTEKFHDKVVGTFVRIRISGSTQKQDMYRLVQVVGLRKSADPYKVGKRTTDLVLEILNLNKTEVVSIDTVSNQEFTEDECKRLRQSIKCGLINRLSVGDILDKATELQAARVNDWLETETVRISHLRDRASEKGRRKELRECVEKLQLLKTPEERRRRLEEIPEIHADPNMDPSYVSEEDDSEMEDTKQDIFMRPRDSSFSKKGREPVSPHRGSFSSKDSWSGTRQNSFHNMELNRNMSNRDIPNKVGEAALMGEIPHENAWNQGRDRDSPHIDSIEKINLTTKSGTAGQSNHSSARSGSLSGAASESSQVSLTAGVTETATKINEAEKMWHYKDPSGKVQGPFSIVQLRKWSNTGYFPPDLRIWKTTEKEDDSLLLTDALAGRFPKELPKMDTNLTRAQTVHSPRFSSTNIGKPYGASLQQAREAEGGERLNFDQNNEARSQLELHSSSGWGTPSVEVPKHSETRQDLEFKRNDSLNLPSPTPKTSTPVWIEGQASESKWSSSSTHQAGSVLVANSIPPGNAPVQSPTIATSGSTQLNPSSISPLINQSVSKEQTLSSLPSSSPAANSGQGNLSSSTTALPTSHTIMAGEYHGMHPAVESHGLVQKQEMVAPGQQMGSDFQAWGGVPSQSNPPLPVPVQPSAYGHWGGTPSTGQNPAANYATPGFAAMPLQPDPWRPPPAVVNQPNIQNAAPPTVVPWGMGVVGSNTFAPGPRPDNANTGWGPMQGNPNMSWGGPAPPGATNMNWVVPGTVNPGWVAAPAGNPVPMVQGLPPGNANPGWVAQTVNTGSAIPGPPPGNGNPGWVGPAGNPGANVQGPPPPGNVNSGWGIPPTGNPGSTVQGPAPGNANPGWGTPPTGNPGSTGQGPAPGNANPGWGGNSGMRGNEKRHNGNSRYSGQRDNRASRGRGDSDFGGGRPWNNSGICRFHQSGYCRKGTSCRHPHS